MRRNPPLSPTTRLLLELLLLLALERVGRPLALLAQVAGGVVAPLEQPQHDVGPLPLPRQV